MEAKKKKNAIILSVTAGVVAVGLAVGLGVGLTVGKKGGDAGNNGGTQTQEPAVDNSKYTVTKAEWENAFDFSDKNCTVKLYYKDEENDNFTFLQQGYFTGDGKAWDKNGEVENLSWQLNTAYMLGASDAYEHFAFDAETKSYKSTSEWSCYLTSPETPTDLSGEVSFSEGKLVCCIVTCNESWSLGGEAGDRFSYKVDIVDYGATVKPADAPENGEE